MVVPVHINDAQCISEIYNYYVLHSGVTFEEEAISLQDMSERIKTITQKWPWLVYKESQNILGYAYAANWKSRVGYRLTVEISVYLKHDCYNKGIGSTLYSALINKLKEIGVHSVIGGVALPNPASIRLHEKFGFEKVAHFKDVGIKFEKWMDVCYWQLQLNS